MALTQIVSTEFKNIKTGEIQLGVRISNKHMTLCIYWKTIPTDGLEIFKKILNMTEGVEDGNGNGDSEFSPTYTFWQNLQDIIEPILDNEEGVYIDGVFYRWSKIEPLFPE